jgi:hypothetical protein
MAQHESKNAPLQSPGYTFKMLFDLTEVLGPQKRLTQLSSQSGVNAQHKSAPTSTLLAM